MQVKITVELRRTMYSSEYALLRKIFDELNNKRKNSWDPQIEIEEVHTVRWGGDAT